MEDAAAVVARRVDANEISDVGIVLHRVPDERVGGSADRLDDLRALQLSEAVVERLEDGLALDVEASLDPVDVKGLVLPELHHLRLLAHHVADEEEHPVTLDPGTALLLEADCIDLVAQLLPQVADRPAAPDQLL